MSPSGLPKAVAQADFEGFAVCSKMGGLPFSTPAAKCRLDGPTIPHSEDEWGAVKRQ
jgi:hypothetical protein